MPINSSNDNGRRRRRSSSEARTRWYTAHRALRVTRREEAKAVMDCVRYGMGAIYREPGKDPRHVSIAEVEAMFA